MESISDENIKKFPLHNVDDWEVNTDFEKKSGKFGVAQVFKYKNKIINDKEVDGLCIIKTILQTEFRHFESNILEILSNDNGHSFKYYGSARDDTNVFIYMEYLENSISLEDLLLFKISLNEQQIYKLFGKIAEALKNIHKNNVIHRDIKDEHVFFILEKGLTKRNSFETIINGIVDVKFIDFGVSKLITEKDGSKYYSYTGTDAYIAPEVKLRNKTACRKSDVYSLGCVLIKMSGGELNAKGGTPNIPTHISDRLIPNKLKNIIQRCITNDPDARFSSEELFNFLTPSSNLNNTSTTIDFKNHTLTSLKEKKPVDKNVELMLLENEHLYAGAIPDDVEMLKIKSTSFNEDIEYDAVPSSVKYIDLGDSFDIKENGTNLPTDSIKTLRCGFNFTIPINGRSLPPSVTDLQLHNYNAPMLKNSIPTSVSYLALGNNFKHFETLSYLPPSIINLKFGCQLADVNIVSKLISDLEKSNPSISSLIINGVDVLLLDDKTTTDVEMGGCN